MRNVREHSHYDRPQLAAIALIARRSLNASLGTTTSVSQAIAKGLHIAPPLPSHEDGRLATALCTAFGQVREPWESGAGRTGDWRAVRFALP